jgi:CRISPR-associated endoribonuclease Cas6
MRIYLKIKAKGIRIPYNHQHLLTGTIHKWMGRNDEHGKLSFYSFSRLEGAKANKNSLNFENETSFFISASNSELIKKIVSGIQADPTMFSGLKVSEIILQEDPDLSERELFFVASPIFIKRRVDTKIDHILFNDLRANACLKETLSKKMVEVGIVDDTFNIAFDKKHSRAASKKVDYNGIANRASWCNVIIKGKPETKAFIWNVGIGNSTGIGFGAIK